MLALLQVFCLNGSMADPTRPDNHETTNNPEVPIQEVLAFAGKLVDEWDFRHESIESTNSFATNIAHWVVETFGQEWDKEYVLFPGDDEFDGDLVPTGLQHLIAYTSRDEMHLSGGNSVMGDTKHDCIETDPFIPEWELIEQLPTFKQQLDYIRGHREVYEAVVPGKIEVIPQVRLVFRPTYHHGWGLEYLVSQLGIKVAPFGELSKTWVPTDYVMDSRHRPEVLAETVCKLSMLAAKFTSQRASGTIPRSSIELLQRRLSGQESLPLLVGNRRYRPRSSVKTLLVEALRAGYGI